MTRAGLAAALLLAALLPGCASIPPAAVGAVAGAVAAAFRFDDDVLRLVGGRVFSAEKKDQTMGIIIPADAVFSLPLVFQDQVGRPVTPPAGGTVAIDNTAVARASLSADGSTVTITPVAAGACNVTYTNGVLTASAPVTIIVPTASSVTFGQGSIAGK